MGNKTILLVEDEVITATLEKQRLEKTGYTVHHVINGEEAVKTVIDNESNYDLILMDIDLGSGIDGTQAAEQILKSKEIPVVFLSSHTEPEIVEKTEKITSYGYVVKSSSITVLDASIKMAFKLFDAKKIIADSEKRYRGLLTNLDSGVVVHAPDTSIIINNIRASELLELNEDQMKGRLAIDPQWKFLFEDNSPLPLEEYPVNRIISSRKPVKNQILGVFRPVADDIVWLVVNGFPVLNDKGEITEIIISFIDITERKKSEIILKEKSEELEATNEELEATNEEFEAMNEELIKTNEELISKEMILQASEEKYRLQFMNMNSYNSMYDVVTDSEGRPCDFRFFMVNQAYEKYVGIKASDLIGRTLLEVYPETEQYWIDKMTEAALTGTPLHFESFSRVMNTFTEINLYTPQKGQLVMTTGNISERRQAEENLRESERTFRKLFEESSDAILLIDETGVFVECNQAALDLLKMTREQFLFLPPVNISPEFQPDGQRSKEAALEMIELAYKKGSHRFDWTCVDAGGGEFMVEVSLMPIVVKGKTMLHTTWRNITERKQAEDEIKKQLSEKETLLKEVHHRIKNNIISIENLLSMQLESVSSPQAVSALQDAIGRISGMRVLYDKLLISEDYKNISIKNYIESLIDAVLGLFANNPSIACSRQIDDFILPSNRLFPLGIIINELLTNIMKYAFNGRDSGLLHVLLEKNQNQAILTIKDNGIGLPDGFEISKTNGFGLMLIEMLSKQIGGTFTVENNNGTRSVLKFEI